MSSTGLDHGAGDPRVGIGLADAGMAVIGVDLDDKIILRRRTGIGAKIRNEQDEAFDFGDLHGVILSCASPCGHTARLFNSSRL